MNPFLDAEDIMGTARTKLNVAYFNGCLFVSAILGLTTGSWAVFWIALAVTIGSGIHGGEIRPSAGKR
jgi:H+/Cl- antiporter ClcA